MGIVSVFCSICSSSDSPSHEICFAYIEVNSFIPDDNFLLSDVHICIGKEEYLYQSDLQSSKSKKLHPKDKNA